MEKESGDVIILHMCTKNHNHIIYASWDMECDWYCFFVILDHFLPFFTPLLTPKIKIWKKFKTYLEILFFYTSVPWLKIIWCLVPEIGSRGDSFFVVFFCFVFFLVILNHFLPFYPPLKCQKSKFLKNGKNIEDVIILHKSTVNENHTMYDSWDMNCKRQIFLSFWHFVILSNNPKLKKKSLEISSF